MIIIYRHHLRSVHQFSCEIIERIVVKFTRLLSRNEGIMSRGQMSRDCQAYCRGPSIVHVRRNSKKEIERFLGFQSENFVIADGT